MEEKSKMHYLIVLSLTLFLNLVNGQNVGDVRLIGSTDNLGRVEVYNDGKWGTICDDQFGLDDARVICKQLGFDNAVRAIHRAAHGQGTGPIWMDGLKCTGDEAKISDCSYNGWGRHDCSHHEDAAVECLREAPELPTNTSANIEIPVRITCPPSNVGGKCNICHKKDGCTTYNPNNPAGVQGILEAKIEGQWYPVSGKKWNLPEAKVACGQLGYPGATRLPPLHEIWPTRKQSRSQYRRRMKRAVLSEMDCSGGESKLSECYIRSYSVTDNDEDSIATVQCLYLEENSDECARDNANDDGELYRLRGGSVPWKGRVEVKRNGAWGTICDSEWGLQDANIVCRNLGYGTAKQAYTRSYFGKGIQDTHYSSLRCTGREGSLSECRSAPAGRLESEINTYCSQHTGDAGVECYIPSEECNKPKQGSRIVGEGTNTFLEILGPQGWGRVCNGSLDYNDAYVACKEHSGTFASSYVPAHDRSYSGKMYFGDIQCTGDELSMSECNMGLVSRSSCQQGFTRVICTEGLPDLVPSLERFHQSLQYYPHVDRLPMYYLTCALEEKCLSSSAEGQSSRHYRNLLRFDSLTMNYGTADFLPNREPHEWEWHACHEHYHSFEAFINYDILDMQGNKVAEGHKASFCLEDSFCIRGGSPQYRCSQGIQGISVNCGDLYGRNLDCQWIDVTDVQPGNYKVRQYVNNDRLVAESNYLNNVIECDVQLYSSRYLRVGECRQSDY